MARYGHHVEIRQVDDVAVVLPLLDNLDHTVFEHLTRNLYRLIDAKQCTKVVVNFENVRFFFSEAVGLLLLMRKRIESSDAHLRLCCVPQTVLDVLDTAGLLNLFAVDDDELAAIGNF